MEKKGFLKKFFNFGPFGNTRKSKLNRKHAIGCKHFKAPTKVSQDVYTLYSIGRKKNANQI